ncbi:hypothetical protein N7474_003244 [Penicillium riverlandense]|uniref:uncharacterized protein n=1 Tax=Penicillium riverlandense TaxID=1903569 RepID=UPI002547742A|nr:uncharacterized protein N7474_003244 [Penicillium riverlandense]KAJ5826106.1 hypothetical protein N7474_003244 [Penicillium riverlandense]
MIGYHCFAAFLAGKNRDSFHILLNTMQPHQELRDYDVARCFWSSMSSPSTRGLTVGSENERTPNANIGLVPPRGPDAIFIRKNQRTLIFVQDGLTVAASVSPILLRNLSSIGH